MAGRLSRVLVALSLPTIFAIVSLYWIRRRKKGAIRSGEELVTDILAEKKCFDSTATLSSTVDQNSVNMQLRESNATNVYANETSNNTSKSKDSRKATLNAEKNKRNVAKRNFLNGDEDATNSRTIVDNLTTDEHLCSHLSASCVIENNENSAENKYQKNSDIVDNSVNECQKVAKKDHCVLLDKHHDNVTDCDVIPEDSRIGATNNCDFNCNNEQFDDRNSKLLLEKFSEGEYIDSTQQDVQHSLKTKLKTSNGCVSGTENGLQLRNFSDAHSEGSSDSGKGSSEIHGSASEHLSTTLEDASIVYQFEIPQELCGLLIGRQGHYVSLIKNETNARVVINRHPFSPYMKICSIEGLRSEIKHALKLIRNRFPVRDYPEVTLQQINVISPLSYPIPVPQSCQLHLPDGVSCDVILSSTVNAGHIFLQQPTHPTYPSLSRLDQFMTANYAPTVTPAVQNPTPGIICAVFVCGGWYRAMVVNVLNDEECEVKFVDYGGYSKVAISSLRQIRFDFMTLPFQASECYLGSIEPIGGCWSAEANAVFEELAQGQILQSNIVGYADDGIPFVHLHKIKGISSIFINQELVDRGFAQWTGNYSWN